MKESAVELIAKERAEQITKHGRDVQSDRECNTEGQLVDAAIKLCGDYIGAYLPSDMLPVGWNREVWDKMTNKSYKERLIIAATLIAAEYDRVNE